MPEPCAVCGSTDRVEAHHPLGYEGPFALKIEWLCPSDHRQAHKEVSATIIANQGLHTLKQAAEILGTTPDNLRGAIQRGSLAARKVGRDWTVTAREVERYRQQNRRVARA